MTEDLPSPKRRRILSSLNPDGHSEPDRSASPSQAAAPDSIPASTDTNDTTEVRASEATPKPTKFRFKSKSSRSSRHHHRVSRHGEDDVHASSSRHGQRHRHRHKPRRRRSPTPADAEEPTPGSGAAESGRLSPDAAFRESLFDAMADDEGAAYWEGVYGQPIHVYSRDKPSAAQGELERMTDDEYAAYVRRKMWEKTHAGLLEERTRQEEERKRMDAEAEEARRIAEEMERSLRRGEERRRRKVWRVAWERYVDTWARWDGDVDGLPWPTRSGNREQIGVEDEVREFFERGLDRDEIGEKEFATRLKEERVRWHPDKVQQRLGGKVEHEVMRDVTAIFQAVDKLWNDTRSKT